MALRIRTVFSSASGIARLLMLLRALVLVLVALDLGNHLSPHPFDGIYDCVLLAVVLCICCVLFLASFEATQRINTITETAERIIATRDLTRRIPIDHRWDYLGKLAHVLNQMLDEIEQLVASVRQVSDNIAHDLRTPLTRLRNHIEQLDSGGASPVVRAEEIPALVAECDAILVTFNALLRIANIEAGRRTVVLQPVDMTTLLRDVVELYEPVASEKNVHLSFACEPTQLMGDKDLLFQALANLIDNALKYTPAGGAVVARVIPGPHGGAFITIRDSGPGIPDEHKQLVFRRFYRISSCRSVPGAGLGLSLVEAVIRLHQGTIALSDRDPNGLVVTVSLK